MKIRKAATCTVLFSALTATTGAHAATVWNLDPSGASRWVACYPESIRGDALSALSDVGDAVWEVDYNDTVQVNSWLASKTPEARLVCVWWPTAAEAQTHAAIAQQALASEHYYVGGDPFDDWLHSTEDSLGWGFSNPIGELQGFFCTDNVRANAAVGPGRPMSSNVRVSGLLTSTDVPRDCALDPSHDFPADRLSVVADERLYVVDPNYLSYTPIDRLGSTWADTAAMTVQDGMLYVVQNNTLWEAHPTTGALRQLGPAGVWSNTAAMTAVGDYLYIIQGDALWQADPANGFRWPLGPAGSWSNTAAMTSVNDMLYVVQNNLLWEANPADGSWRQLGPAGWPDTAAMTAVNGLLYIIQGDTLWETQPSNGQWQQLGITDNWVSAVSMTSADGWIYVLRSGSLWRIAPVDGSYQRVGLDRDWLNSVAIAGDPDVPPASCVHNICVEGAPANDSCGDSCVVDICAVDPYCCNVSWDAICVAEVASICGGGC